MIRVRIKGTRESSINIKNAAFRTITMLFVTLSSTVSVQCLFLLIYLIKILICPVLINQDHSSLFIVFANETETDFANETYA